MLHMLSKMTFRHPYSLLYILQGEASEQHLYTAIVMQLVIDLPPSFFHKTGVKAAVIILSVSAVNSFSPTATAEAAGGWIFG